MDEERQSELEQLVHAGNASGVTEAVADVDFDAAAQSSIDALQSAIQLCSWDCVLVLIGRGKMSLRESGSGGLLLQHAAAAGRLDMIELAVDSGCAEDLRTKAGTNLLLSATASDRIDIVRYAAAHGLDVATQGQEAALVAARDGRWDVVDLLVELGVDLQAAGTGVQLLALAAVNERSDLRRRLEQKGVSVNAASKACCEGALRRLGSTQCWAWSRDAVRWLLLEGADASTEAAAEVLLTAALYADLEVVRLLIEGGVDVKSSQAGEALARAGELGGATAAAGADVVKYLETKGVQAQSAPALVVDEDF
eukprot:TRINITY_DN24962_c0_g1_i1.p1 TRINITY_DN24962_c0_g1~~TRINITY_DN24962_c0_g1_i1.p1  ORF type:complete len:310 (+),score=91.46 TRINITY_DN24962_c0_g1_i1:60-989(+)